MAQLAVVVGVAKARQRVVVEEHSVAFRTDYEGYADFRVVLKQFLVTPFVVPFVSLMLPQSVEGFIGKDILKHRARAPAVVRLGRAVGMNLRAGIWPEPLAAAFKFAEHGVALAVSKPYLACSGQYMRLHLWRGHGDGGALLAHLIIVVCCLRHDD